MKNYKIRELRNSLHLTQQNMADFLHCPRQTYGSYESETNDIPTVVLKALSMIFCVSTDYILGLKDDKERASLADVKNLSLPSKIEFFYPRLLELRKEAALSQQAISQKIGCSQQLYSNYECGKRDLSIKNLISLAQLYDVSTDYILGLKDER